MGGSVKKTYLFERVSWREKEIEIGREGRRGREKETPSFCWSTPQMAMLGQSQEFLPGLPCGFRGPGTWVSSMAFPRAIIGNWIESGLLGLKQAQVLIWDGGAADGGLTHYMVLTLKGLILFCSLGVQAWN